MVFIGKCGQNFVKLDDTLTPEPSRAAPSGSATAMSGRRPVRFERSNLNFIVSNLKKRSNLNKKLRFEKF